MYFSFDELPMLDLKTLRKTNRMRLPKSQRLELRKKKLERAAQKLKLRE